MRNAAHYSIEHKATRPRGWKVRSKRTGAHLLRIAYPPGGRKEGSGKLLEILHPEKNPICANKGCPISKKAETNPGELLIFGNPSRLEKMRATRERAGRIRGARLSNASPEYIARELLRAEEKYDAARIARDAAKTPAARRAADEDLQFWGNKIAFLSGGKKNPAKKFEHRKAETRKDLARFVRQHPKRQRKEILSQFPGHRRRNPTDTEQAVKLFESFHGKDAQEIIDAQRSAAMRLDYTALGKLVALGFDDGGFSAAKLPQKWDECSHVSFEDDGVMLASSPNGKQLYFIDGNQNLDSQLSDFPHVDTEKDLIDLGDVFFVVYEARKVHDGFKVVDYCHRFGEHNKTLPRLAYDKLKKEMLLIGGEYFIDTKHGISPGIEG